VNTPEPYQKRTAHGMIHASDGEKMSKSKGNVINPDDIIKEFGADTLRAYEMFIGAFELSANWQTDGIKGCRRFLDRVWKLAGSVSGDTSGNEELTKKIHKTIKKVSDDYEKMKYNTAVAALMALTNDFHQESRIGKKDYEILLTLLNPVAPHMTEELWQLLGNKELLCRQNWPEYDEKLAADEVVEIGVQVNGKLRGTIMTDVAEPQEGAMAKAYENENVQKFLEGNTPVKVIYVPGKILNIIVKYKTEDGDRTERAL